MRFTVSSTALSSKLNALSRVINSKNSLPILGDFLFDIHNGVLYLTASDSENVMKTQIELTDCDGEGRFCIGNHDLLEAVKGFSEQPITFDVDQMANMAKISYQNGMFSLPVEGADDFPQPTGLNFTANEIVISNSMLAENINRSLFATAQDELRPVMNGIYFDLTPECLSVVASDGHKLVRNKLLNIHSEQPAAFILPKKPASLLKGLLGKDGGDVTIRFDERNAQINYGDGELICRLIEGRYPNYNSVIPQNNPNQLTVDRQTLLAALRRVQPFANDSSNLIRFHVEGGTLQLDAEDYDFSKTATERMSCEYNGQPMSIGFKGSSFIEILGNFDCQEVIIQLADPSRAGLVLPSEQPENQDVLMLMMPMLIND
jgi:DNA polymerase-3 subunit beta